MLTIVLTYYDPATNNMALRCQANMDRAGTCQARLLSQFNSPRSAHWWLDELRQERPWETRKTRFKHGPAAAWRPWLESSYSQVAPLLLSRTNQRGSTAPCARIARG